MTTEKISEDTTPTTTNDNKAVFAPLGKYAAVAVIMVGIIITTAIMLDKQLKTVEEQLAELESEAAAAYATESDTTTDAIVANKETSATAETNTTAKAETKAEATSETVAVAAAPIATPVAIPVKTAIEAPTAEVLVAQETATTADVTEISNNTVQTRSAAELELATAETSAQTSSKTRQAQLAKENQARIDAFKAEQKKNMSEMFARIKTLEAQQLNRYKANQDDQITRLRKQITEQQQQIESLVLRNKDLFDLRAANVQRVQANREQVLNRI